ncbi:LolA family protein [Onishia niordana]|uniref:LolA family protein n=1 Tax=Onishia niordana TaxID=2508711 RepID=UPI0010A0C068|nr:outer membrane lipoprotein carrier protein LolA [Halomonas niordiana]
MNIRVLAMLPLAMVCLPAQAFDLNDLETRLTASEWLQGHFRQRHWMADQEVRLHSQGRFLYQRDRQLIWLFGSPTQQVLTFAKGQVAYGPDSDEKADIQALLPERSTFQRHMVDIMGGKFSALADDYRLVLSGDNDAWQVTMTPRLSALEMPLATMTLTGSERLEHLKMTIANGDTLSIRLSDGEAIIDESLVSRLAGWLTDESTTVEEDVSS